MGAIKSVPECVEPLDEYECLQLRIKQLEEINQRVEKEKAEEKARQQVEEMEGHRKRAVEEEVNVRVKRRLSELESARLQEEAQKRAVRDEVRRAVGTSKAKEPEENGEPEKKKTRAGVHKKERDDKYRWNARRDGRR